MAAPFELELHIFYNFILTLIYKWVTIVIQKGYNYGYSKNF